MVNDKKYNFYQNLLIVLNSINFFNQNLKKIRIFTIPRSYSLICRFSLQ